MSGPRKLGAFARNEKALGLLSCRLMSLLREAEGSAMDVDAATVALALTRKRRIYDVICVLEGIGLIEKKANFIQLKDVDGCNTKSALGRRKILEAEIQDLDLEEKELNKQIFLLDQSIQGIMEEPSMKLCSYVTPEDIYNCFDAEDALLIVHAPAGSQVMIPVPEMGQNEQLKYQMILKSRPGPVRLLLVNQEYSSSEPILYPVPAPDDPTQPATQVTPQCQAISMPAPALAEGQDQGTPSAAAPSDCSVAPNSTATTSSSDPEPSPSLAADNTHTTARLNNYLPSVPLEVRTSVKTSPLEVGEFDECGDTLISDIIELMSSDGILIAEIIDELMSSQVFPHLPHSPTTGDGAKFNEDDYDGVRNLLNV